MNNDGMAFIVLFHTVISRNIFPYYLIDCNYVDDLIQWWPKRVKDILSFLATTVSRKNVKKNVEKRQ